MKPINVLALLKSLEIITCGSVAVVAALHDRWWIVLAVGVFYIVTSGYKIKETKE